LTKESFNGILSIHMKILILGGKGMLGRALTEKFKENGNEVLSWGREELDISDQAATAAAITSDIDVIINAAGQTDIDAAEANIDGAMKVNAYPAAALADICNLLGMTYVHFSSEHVFPGRDSKGYAEKDKTEPLSSYGRSKVQGEKFSSENDRTYLIRSSRLFGEPGVSKNAKESFVDEMVKKVRSGGTVNAVHDEVAAPTYVNDLSEAVHRLLAEKKPFGTYHITNSGFATWYQLAQKINELVAAQAVINPIARRDEPLAAPRPRYGMLVNTRLPSLRNWEAALEEYLRK
jgi:dTDP-4-dehydrorhamnose reductase